MSATLSSDTIYYILTYLANDYVSIGKIARVNWQFYDVVYFPKQLAYYDDLWKQMSNLRWPFSSLGQLAHVKEIQSSDEENGDETNDFSQVELQQLWRTFYLTNHQLDKKWTGGRAQIDWKVKTIRQSSVESWSHLQLFQTSGHLYTLATSISSDSQELFIFDRSVANSNVDLCFKSSSKPITDQSVKPFVNTVSLKDNFSVVYSLDKKELSWVSYHSKANQWIHKEQMILTSDSPIVSIQLIPLQFLKKSQHCSATDLLFKQLSNEFILLSLHGNGSIQVFHMNSVTATSTFLVSFQAQKSVPVLTILSSSEALQYGSTSKQPFVTLPICIGYGSDLEYWELQVSQAGKWSPETVQVNHIISTNFINRYQFQYFKEQLYRNEIIALEANKLVVFDITKNTIHSQEFTIAPVQFASVELQTKQFVLFTSTTNEVHCFDTISKRIIWTSKLQDTCCAMMADAHRIAIGNTNSKSVVFVNSETGKDYGYHLMYGSNFSDTLIQNLSFSHSGFCGSVGNAIRIWCFE